MVGCQLITTNNTIGGLLPNVPNNNTGVGPYDTIEIAKWTGTTFAATAVGSSFDYDGVSNFGWDPTSANAYTLNPGEGAFFRNNAATNIVITFVGQVPQGTNTVTMLSGPSGAYNMIASPVPQSGGITSVLGLEPAGIQYSTFYGTETGGSGGGDELTLFNVNSQTYSATAVEDDFSGNGTPIQPTNPDSAYTIPWDTEPVPAVGQAFWYRVTPGCTNLVWTRIFSVNQ